MLSNESGETLLDFGQDLVGSGRFDSAPPCKSGETITIRHAEVLEDEEMAMRPLRVKCADTVVCESDPSLLKDWHPRFTFHGFRYDEVSGWTGIGVDDISAVVLSSDLEPCASFDCSHSAIDQLHRNIVSSWRGNSVSIPTDCPQRDGRPNGQATLSFSLQQPVSSPTQLDSSVTGFKTYQSNSSMTGTESHPSSFPMSSDPNSSSLSQSGEMSLSLFPGLSFWHRVTCRSYPPCMKV